MAQLVAVPGSIEPKNAELTSEIGVTFDLPFSTPFDKHVEYPSVEDVPIESLIRMRRTDGQVRALIRILMLPIRAALRDAKIVPPRTEDGKSMGGEEEARFIHDMFWLPPEAGGMSTTMERFVSQSMAALLEGFAVHEMVYKVPAEGPLAGKIVLDKLARRPAHTLTWLLHNRTGDMVGVRQRANYNGKQYDVVIPGEDLFYFAANEDENPYYGVSYFLPAYYHWDKKVKMYYVAHLAAQHRAVPGRVGTMPTNASGPDKVAFKAALRDYGLGASVVLPSELWKIEEFGKQLAQFPWVDFINHHNSQSSKSVLAQFLDSGDQKSLVDFSTKDDEMFVLELTAILNDFASQINSRIIPKFINWNFGSKLYPQFEFPAITDEQRDKIQELFATMSTSPNLQTSPDFMHELEKRMADMLGLEVDYNVVDKEFQDKKAAQQEQEQLAIEAGKATVDVQKATAETTRKPVPAPAPKGGPGTVATSRESANEPVFLSQLAREVFEEMRSAPVGVGA